MKKLIIEIYNDNDIGYVDLKDFLYHYLRIFSLIITYLNKQIFHDFMEWLEFIIIDQ